MTKVINITEKIKHRWSLEQALYFCKDMIDDCDDEDEMMRSDVETNIYHLKLLYEAALKNTFCKLEDYPSEENTND